MNKRESVPYRREAYSAKSVLMQAAEARKVSFVLDVERGNDNPSHLKELLQPKLNWNQPNPFKHTTR